MCTNKGLQKCIAHFFVRVLIKNTENTWSIHDCILFDHKSNENKMMECDWLRVWKFIAISRAIQNWDSKLEFFHFRIALNLDFTNSWFKKQDCGCALYTNLNFKKFLEKFSANQKSTFNFTVKDSARNGLMGSLG